MVEMDFPFAEERRRFDQFYANHISMLLNIDGFISAQRFEAIHSTASPLLAIYQLRSADTMSGEAYQSKAGPKSITKEFKAKMRHWHRNLFDGEVASIVVNPGDYLIVRDMTDETKIGDADSNTLRCIGLDRTVSSRQIRITDLETASNNGERAPNERIFRPLHPIRHA